MGGRLRDKRDTGIDDNFVGRIPLYYGLSSLFLRFEVRVQDWSWYTKQCRKELVYNDYYERSDKTEGPQFSSLCRKTIKSAGTT